MKLFLSIILTILSLQSYAVIDTIITRRQTRIPVIGSSGLDTAATRRYIAGYGFTGVDTLATTAYFASHGGITPPTLDTSLAHANIVLFGHSFVANDNGANIWKDSIQALYPLSTVTYVAKGGWDLTGMLLRTRSGDTSFNTGLGDATYSLHPMRYFNYSGTTRNIIMVMGLHNQIKVTSALNAYDTAVVFYTLLKSLGWEVVNATEPPPGGARIVNQGYDDDYVNYQKYVDANRFVIKDTVNTGAIFDWATTPRGNDAYNTTTFCYGDYLHPCIPLYIDGARKLITALQSLNKPRVPYDTLAQPIITSLVQSPGGFTINYIGIDPLTSVSGVDLATDGGLTWTFNASGGTTSANITGLTDGIPYRVRLRGVKIGLESAYTYYPFVVIPGVTPTSAVAPTLDSQNNVTNNFGFHLASGYNYSDLEYTFDNGSTWHDLSPYSTVGGSAGTLAQNGYVINVGSTHIPSGQLKVRIKAVPNNNVSGNTLSSSTNFN